MAVIITFGSAFSASPAAPVPRPPQPISPTFKVLLFDVQIELDPNDVLVAKIVPTVANPAVLINCLLEYAIVFIFFNQLIISWILLYLWSFIYFISRNWQPIISSIKCSCVCKRFSIIYIY